VTTRRSIAVKKRIVLAVSFVFTAFLASAQTLKWDLKPMPDGFYVPQNKLRVHDGKLIPQISMIWLHPDDDDNLEVTVIPRSLYRKANGPLCPSPGYEWVEPDNLSNFDVRPIQREGASSSNSTPAPPPPRPKPYLTDSGQCSLAADSNSAKVHPSSGNPDFDKMVYSEVPSLVGEFGVAPKFLFEDDADAPNAHAWPNDVTGGGLKGTVTLGIGLLSLVVKKDSVPQDSVRAILAHEFAHIVQFERNNNLTTCQKELQADILSGWYLGRRHRDMKFGDISAAAQRFFELGDEGYYAPDHHGSPRIRYAAHIFGFNATFQNEISLDDMYNKSLGYAVIMAGSDPGTCGKR